MHRKALPKRQKQVLDFIYKYHKENWCPPTIREIQAYLGLKSTNYPKAIVEALVQKGYFVKTSKKSRGIKPS